MAGSRLLGPFGKSMVPALRRPGPMGRGDGAAPDAEAFLIGNTPGALGRADWADPDHPAFELRLKLPQFSMLSALDAEHRHVSPHLPAPKIPRHKEKTDDLPPETRGKFEDPPWLKVACGEEARHVVEEPTLEKNNERVLEYLTTAPGLANIEYTYKVKTKDGKRKTIHTGKMMSEVDETAWCGCFVMWCLAQAKIKVKGLAMAKDWLTSKKMVEEPIGSPRVGSIVIVHHKATKAVQSTTSSGYHVAFYLGGSAEEPVLLGGNQGNKICRKRFKGGWEVLGYRWPAAASQK